jgi:hypothetical protein
MRKIQNEALTKSLSHNKYEALTKSLTPPLGGSMNSAQVLLKYMDDREKENDINLFCIVIQEEVPDWITEWWSNVVEINKDMIIPFPETNHGILHQSAYVKKLVSDRRKNKDKRRRVILTRSAFNISNFDRRAVFIIRGSKIEFPEFQTFGASVNKINMLIMGNRNTIGDLASTKLKRDLRRSKDMNLEQLDELINTISNKYGDSVEKTIGIHNLINLEDDLKKSEVP